MWAENAQGSRIVKGPKPKLLTEQQTRRLLTPPLAALQTLRLAEYIAREQLKLEPALAWLAGG